MAGKSGKSGVRATSNKWHKHAEGLASLWETVGQPPIWACRGKQGANLGKEPSVCVCVGRSPFPLQCPFSTVY